MIHLWFTLLVETTRAVATNSTTSSCHPIASSGTTRTLWSILGSCALTIIICVWQAVHPDFPRQCADDPEPYWLRRDIKIFTQMGYIFFAFFAPEGMVLFATTQWLAACSKWKELEPKFREAGYPWSFTHCLFAEMNGFVYCDEDGSLRTINSSEFLDLCRDKAANKVANPVITKDEIDGLGRSDGLGKTVLVFQLFWFISQVGARHFSGLTITLVELDSVCMATLTVVLICLWWEKPLRPAYPHIFYSPRCLKAVLIQAPKEDRWCPLLRLVAPSAGCVRSLRKLMLRIGRDHVQRVEPLHGVFAFASLYAAWLVFGALHVAAWNFPFVTQREKIAWCIASVILTASPLTHISLYLGRLLQRLFGYALEFLLEGLPEQARVLLRPLEQSALQSWWRWGELSSMIFILLYGFGTRLILVVLILISLRSLPCSAYKVVPWTAYIPHL